MKVLFVFFLSTILHYSYAQKIAKLNFEIDHHIPTNKSLSELEKIISSINSKSLDSIVVLGHTDTDGNTDYNLALSAKRAAYTKTWLKEKFELIPVYNYYYGEKKVLNDESSYLLKSANRRVEIIFYSKNVDSAEKESLAQDEVSLDTTIILPQGSQLTLSKDAFEGRDIKEIQFEFDEAFSKNEMIMGNLSTQDVNGNCLISDGMLFSSANFKGEEIKTEDTVMVKIPVDSYDSTMRLYDMKVINGDTVWEESKIMPQLSGNGNYYEFPSVGLPKINLDVPGVGLVADGIGSLLDKLRDKTVTIKTRRHKIETCKYVGSEENIVLLGERINTKRHYFSPCDNSQQNYILVIAERKDQLYYSIKRLEELRFKSFFNRYAFKKKYFLPYNEDEFIAEVENLFG